MKSSASGLQHYAVFSRTSGGVFYVGRAANRPPFDLGQEVVLFLGLEIVRRRGATAQAFTVSQLLDIAQPSGDAAVAIAVIAVEGHADLAIATGVHFALIEDGLNLCVHNLGA